MAGLTNDPDYFQELQTRTGWGRVLERFADWIDPQTGWRALDAGCGPGLLPALLHRHGCRAFGIDVDPAMFQPAPLHTQVAVAAADDPPFSAESFHLITCSNLLFLHPRPTQILDRFQQLLAPGGQLAVLNPSERLSVRAAIELASSMGLSGLARESLLNFAARAERHRRWTEADTVELMRTSRLVVTDMKLTMGPGFVRFCRAVKKE